MEVYTHACTHIYTSIDFLNPWGRAYCAVAESPPEPSDGSHRGQSSMEGGFLGLSSVLEHDQFS